MSDTTSCHCPAARREPCPLTAEQCNRQMAAFQALELENARLRRDLDLTRAAFRASISEQEKP